MSIESYARIDPSILSGYVTWAPASIAAGASNVKVALATLPAPLVDSILMGWWSSTYGYGAAAGSCALDVIRADTGAIINAPSGGTYQTSAATSWTMSKVLQNITVPAGTSLGLQVQYTVNTTNCYFALGLGWLLIPKNVGAFQPS